MVMFYDVLLMIFILFCLHLSHHQALHQQLDFKFHRKKMRNRSGLKPAEVMLT